MKSDELLDELNKLLEIRAEFLNNMSVANLKNAKTKKNDSIILHAIYNGSMELAKTIRSYVQNIDIAEASALGELQTLEKLLETNKDTNVFTSDGFTPLTLACAFSGSVDTVACLLKNGAEINTFTINDFVKVAPIHACMFGAKNDLLEFLLKNGANSNLDQDDKESYPLHVAVSRNDGEAISLLLKYGAKKGNKTIDGKTAIDLAKENNFQEALNLLA